MEGFEAEGLFWLAAEPERPLAGNLIFNATEGATLKIFGRFSTLESLSSADPPKPVRIHGNTSRGEVTLEDCWTRGYSFAFGGMEKETFRVNYTLTGAHLPGDFSLEFDGMAAGFDQLAPWVRRGQLKREIDPSEPNDPSSATTVRIEYSVPREESAPAGADRILLASAWATTGDTVTHSGVKQDQFFKVEYSERKSLDQILLDINGLQDLITLTIDAPTIPTEVTLWRNDLQRELGPDRTALAMLKLHVSNAAEHVRLSEHQSVVKILFPFDEIGGIATAGQWLDVSRKYRTILGGLLTVKYSARLYEENQYSNVITAAESLHRMRFPNELVPKVEAKARRRKIVKTVRRAMGAQTSDWLNSQLLFSNEPRLRQRLLELTDYAGESFAFVAGSVDQWVSVVSGIRNRLTHHDENRPLDRHPGDVYFLTQSVYVLVMLCLLRECGVDPKKFSRIKRAPAIRYLSDQVGEIIPRYARSLRG